VLPSARRVWQGLPVQVQRTRYPCTSYGSHSRSSNTPLARACVCLCVRLCACARAWVRVCVCVCVIVLISAAFSVCGNQHLRRAEGASVVHTSIVRDMSKRHNRFLINEPVKSGQLVRTVSSIMLERTQLDEPNLTQLCARVKVVEMTGIVMDTEQLKPVRCPLRCSQRDAETVLTLTPFDARVRSLQSVPELGEYHVGHCYQHRDLCFDMRFGLASVSRLWRGLRTQSSAARSTGRLATSPSTSVACARRVGRPLAWLRSTSTATFASVPSSRPSCGDREIKGFCCCC
jgi:hypothetical protein